LRTQYRCQLLISPRDDEVSISIRQFTYYPLKTYFVSDMEWSWTRLCDRRKKTHQLTLAWLRRVLLIGQYINFLCLVPSYFNLC
jgi:hypothetical protein